MRSYTILKRELKKLREFYEISASSYVQVHEILHVKSSVKATSLVLDQLDLAWNADQKRLRKTTTKNQVETILRELILVRAISALETFLTDAIRDIFVVNKAPFMDKSVRIDVSQEEYMTNSTQTKIFSKVINKETRKLTSGGFTEFIKYYKKRFDIDISSISPGYATMNEYHDRRHILVHRMGQTDNYYRTKYGTEEKKLQVDQEYLEKLFKDLSTFSAQLEKKVREIIDTAQNENEFSNARFVVDIDFLNEGVPNCLRPSFQFWADDEYVVMTDILLGTSQTDTGQVRYSFKGSDRALGRLRRYLIKEQKSLIFL